jgi:hypothetical protein
VDLNKLNKVFSMAISARRHQFSSRQAALAYFQRHPAFVLLDPRVAHAYVDYGLEEEEPGMFCPGRRQAIAMCVLRVNVGEGA